MANFKIIIVNRKICYFIIRVKCLALCDIVYMYVGETRATLCARQEGATSFCVLSKVRAYCMPIFYVFRASRASPFWLLPSKNTSKRSGTAAQGNIGANGRNRGRNRRKASVLIDSAAASRTIGNGRQKGKC